MNAWQILLEQIIYLLKKQFQSAQPCIPSTSITSLQLDQPDIENIDLTENEIMDVENGNNNFEDNIETIQAETQIFTKSPSIETKTTTQRKRDASPISIPERPMKLLRVDSDSLKFYFLDAFENIYTKPVCNQMFISPDASVPKECQTVEVWAKCNFGRIPTNFSGDCFSHVMNTTTTALERVLIEREIYGPCWLQIRNAKKKEDGDPHVSYCQHEYSLNMDQMDYISMSSTLPTPLPPPSITLVALNILTALNPKTKDIQIVMISLIHHSCNLEMSTNFDPKSLITKRFCVVSKFNKGLPLPFDLEDQLKKNGISSMIRKVGDELSLLNIFLSKIAELDPDMIL
uniref:DNA-directed DNA polymerase family B exonuclease domain-containing protein n=1 Tax=Meloidogyne incognita TaxID=6306 RepID=A0A914NNZ3_MELIC